MTSDSDLVLTGGLHEWFTGDDRPRVSAWLPPMCVLIGLARRAVEAEPARRVLWIGRRCWPYPPALLRPGAAGIDRRLLDASVFVDPEAKDERVWAIEIAARCAGVGVVIGDGSGITMPESRRLQLAAKGTPLLLARPAWEVAALSAARTRWRVSPLARYESERDRAQGWVLELLRCKGVQAETPGGVRRWVVRRDHGTGFGPNQIEDGWRRWSAGNGGLAATMGNGPDSASRTRIA